MAIKPDWMQTLERDGYVVVPNVIPKEACAEFREQALSWLEKFPHGFKRDDKSTWNGWNLPFAAKGGLYNRYAVNHEKFVWDIRAQPGIRKLYEQLWGTNDLIVSFDGMNASFPINEKHGRTDIEPTAAWPHIDQDPREVDRFELYQGIAQLGPSGPNDGGLCVLTKSHLLHEQYFAETGGWLMEQDAGVGNNNYRFFKVGQEGEEQLDWYKAKGCKSVKVEANEGDFILWDSRTIHWNASPTGEQTRFSTYVCMCPRTMMTDAELEKKIQLFKNRKGTTHWPCKNVVPVERLTYHDAFPRRPDDSIDPANRSRPFIEPSETPEVLSLIGVRP